VKTRLYEIMEEKLLEFKKLISARYFSEEEEDNIEESETIHPKYTPKLKTGQSVKVKETGKSGKVGSMVHPHYYSVTVDGKTQTYHHDELQEKIDDQEEQLEVLKQGDTDEPKKKELGEANVTRQGRLKVIKVRIRNGKVQRRKKVSGVKGYTLRAGRLKRITPAEHRRRKLGARRGKFKRKAKLSRIRTKMRRSMRRRHSMGL